MTLWAPPSDSLTLCNDLWTSNQAQSVSYPEHGNDSCLQIEGDSFWFSHRNECILSIVNRLPPGGDVYDIGGGNGFVCLSLQKAGIGSVLVEPGSGARNAIARGVPRVVNATLDDAAFHSGSLPSAAAFDVLEHIEDDVSFMRTVHRLLRPGGRFYGTVPALQALWSDQDDYAGHFRRHDRQSISLRLKEAGFEIEFAGYFFSWLVLPVSLLRALPYRLRRRPSTPTLDSAKRDHTLPPLLSGILGQVHKWETAQLSGLRSPPLGASLIFCARKLFP